MSEKSDRSSWIESIRAGSEHALDESWNKFSQDFAERALAWIESAQAIASKIPEYRELNQLDAFFSSLAAGVFDNQRGEKDLWRIVCVVTQAELLSQSKRVADTAAFADEVAAVCRRMIRLLAESEYEAMILWKLLGETNETIARRLVRTRRTVQRMLKFVREIWIAEI